MSDRQHKPPENPPQPAGPPPKPPDSSRSASRPMSADIAERLRLAADGLRNCDGPVCTYRDRLAHLLDDGAAALEVALAEIRKLRAEMAARRESWPTDTEFYGR